MIYDLIQKSFLNSCIQKDWLKKNKFLIMSRRAPCTSVPIARLVHHSSLVIAPPILQFQKLGGLPIGR